MSNLLGTTSNGARLVALDREARKGLQACVSNDFSSRSASRLTTGSSDASGTGVDVGETTADEFLIIEGPRAMDPDGATESRCQR